MGTDKFKLYSESESALKKVKFAMIKSLGKLHFTDNARGLQ